DEAMTAYRRSLAFEEKWLSAEPGSVAAAMAVSYSHSDIALILFQQKRFVDSLEHYRQTIEIRERMAKLDPNDAWARGSLSSVYSRIADVLSAMDRGAEAAEYM